MLQLEWTTYKDYFIEIILRALGIFVVNSFFFCFAIEYEFQTLEFSIFGLLLQNDWTRKSILWEYQSTFIGKSEYGYQGKMIRFDWMEIRLMSSFRVI